MSRRSLSQGEDDSDNSAQGNQRCHGDGGHGFQREGAHGKSQNGVHGPDRGYYHGTGHDGAQRSEQEYMRSVEQDYMPGTVQKGASHRFAMGREDVHSPLSTYSTHSHEVKHFLRAGSYEDETLEKAAYSDYSHISIRAKPLRSGCESTSSRTASVSSNHSHKENFAPIQSHLPPSSVISEPLHPRSHHGGSNVDLALDPLRRKSWSPPALRQNIDHAGYYNVRTCRSNDMVDWNIHCQDPPNLDVPYTHSRGNLASDGAVENLPPRLAPVSGVLTEKPGRNLIRPIAFKPLHSSHGNIRSPPQGGQRLSDHKDNAGHPFGPPPPYSQPPGVHHPQPLQQPPPPNFHAVNTYVNTPRLGDAAGGNDRSANHSSESVRPVDRGESPLGTSLDASRLSGHSHQSGSGAQVMDVVVHTPSPSDSGVGELEAMLREKDAEILTLRQVMDRNERAIFQVYEEKKNAWLRDLREMKEEYEQKLRMQQRRAHKAEQNLSLQVCKLQQEKQQSQGEYEALFAEKEALKRQCATFQHQLHDVRLQLEAATSANSTPAAKTPPVNNASPVSVKSQSDSQSDAAEFERLRQRLASAEEELSSRNREVIGLRSQLHTLQTDIDTKNRDLSEKFREIVAKTEELKIVRAELSRLSAEEADVCDGVTQTSHSDSEVSAEENVRPSMLTQKDQTIASLQEQVDSLQERVREFEDKLQDVDGVMETERLQWLEEKNKVIRYQKQLQLNYVQMQRKNTALEAEVEQLTLELESRDLKLIAMNGEESVC